MGFPTPLRQWLMDSRADALLAQLKDRDGLLAPYIDFTYLNDLLARHQSGLEDATDRIWRLLNLQLWGNIFIIGNRYPPFYDRDLSHNWQPVPSKFS